MLGLRTITAKQIIVSVALLNCVLLFHGEVFRDTPNKHFREGTIGTQVSVLLLFLAGLTGLRIFNRRRDQIIWLLIGLGFVFLALDDGLKIHENLDWALHGFLSLEENSFSRRIDDMLIGLYGVIGVLLLYWQRSEVLRYPGLLPYLAAGFVFFVGAVFLDTLSNDNALSLWMGFSETSAETIKLWSRGLEEVCKLMAGAVLLSGFLHVLRLVKTSSGNARPVV